MNVFSLMAKLSLDKSDYEKGLNEAKNDADSSGGSFGKAFSTIAKVGATALAGASTAVVAFGKKAVQTGMEFDASMSQVEATMGENASKIIEYNGKSVTSMEALRDFAQQMGATTAFSASQSAEALNYMALAGYDAETSMSMLPTVLSLASAGGIELAQASDMVTDAQSALGLSLEETSEMVDKMAKASQISNTSVAQLGEAFLTVGGTAKDLKGGTTELSQVLGILADNGVKGAEGGTALRNMMLSLEAPTDQASDALEALGVAIFDEEGNMRSMQSIFSDLNESMEDMSAGQKTNVLSNIFNKVDLKSVNALLATDVERWDELSIAIDNSSGSAEKMAEVQLDNLSGDITLLKSAFEGFQIAVSEGATGGLRDFVQFAGNSLGDITKAYKEGGINGAMNTMNDVIKKGITLLSSSLPKIAETGMSLLNSLISGITSNIPQLAQSATSIIVTLAEGIISNLPTIVESAVELVVSLAEGFASALPELIPQAIEAIITIAESLLDNVDKIIDAGINILMALLEGLFKALPRLIQKIPEIIVKIVKALVDARTKLFEASLEMIDTLWQGLKDNLPTLLSKIPEIISGVVQTLKDGASNMAEIGGEWIQKLWDGIGDKIEWLKEKIKSLVGNVKEWLKKFFGGGGESEGESEGGGGGRGGLTKGFRDFGSVSYSATASSSSNNAVVNAINDMRESLYSDLVDALSESLTFEWDDREVGRMVKNYA